MRTRARRRLPSKPSTTESDSTASNPEDISSSRSPSPKQSPTASSPPKQEEQEDHDPFPPCEFTNPCTTTSPPSPSSKSKPSSSASAKRKVISHIFGRNKTSTKLFPPHVWVYYCRKHYQRARYRSAQWPFTQCELLMDSLGRMETWGGVGSFEVVLRRREVVRRVSLPLPARASTGRSGSERAATHSADDGDEGEEDEDEDENADETESATTPLSPTPSTDSYHSYQCDIDIEVEDEDYYNGEDDEEDDLPSNSQRQRRKKPVIIPCPVPDWLRQEVGPNKSFNEIRDIVRRIREYMAVQREEGHIEAFVFPDIEILPTFLPWVIKMDKEERARKKAGKGKRVSRVSRKGAVQKIRG